MRPTPRSLLQQAHVPALLISDLTNLRSLTGVEVSSALLLALPRTYVLFVSPLYAEAVRQEVCEGIAVRDLSEIDRFLKRLPACGFEQEVVTVARWSQWKRGFPETKFLKVTGAVEEFRRQKDAAELRAMRRAIRITREMLRRVPAALRTTTTERGLAWKLRQWAQELGAEGLAFDPIVAFGSHTSRPHHHPTGRVLQKGHIVQIDVGAKFHGYCADFSEVFFTAKPTKEQERAYRAVREAKDAAIDLLCPGVTTHALDGAARKVLRSYGYEDAFTHALGHGVGLEIHEGVTLSSARPPKELLLNEVIAIEPGVYFPGKFGIRLEETVIVGSGK